MSRAGTLHGGGRDGRVVDGLPRAMQQLPRRQLILLRRHLTRREERSG